MAQYKQHHYHEETVKTAKHSRESNDLRVILANYILNFEFPRDVYMLLIAIVTLYLILKLIRLSVGMVASMVRPVVFVVLILVLVPYFYEMIYNNNFRFNRLILTAKSVGENVFQIINSIYLHTIQFYAK